MTNLERHKDFPLGVDGDTGKGNVATIAAAQVANHLALYNNISRHFIRLLTPTTVQEG